MRSSRLWVVLILMCAAGMVLHLRGDVDHVLPSLPLNQIPTNVSDRTATEIPLDDEVLQVLGKGNFLNRVYMADQSPGQSADSRAPIGLFIGYFPTQRTGQSIHSPQNCLPGAGWTFLSSGDADFTDKTGKQYSVGDYLITDGRTTQEVLYWYQMHGRSVANDYKAKLYTLADSIRLGRTDAALVRIITPLNADEDRSVARKRAITFAQQITPILPEFIPN